MLSIYLFKFKKIKTTDKSTHERQKSMKYEQTDTKENDLK